MTNSITVEQQLLAIERDAVHTERMRLQAAEDLLALVDEELAAMRRILRDWPR
ncbi:hypothetical protein AB0C27_53835 [Nonomuraea sp. NPDC048882]|uniref:hypothetical protein n=1 Tax=Nonomuraea sp. NPDC048882 TaxID=3154347 RepID=UPI0033FA1912